MQTTYRTRLTVPLLLFFRKAISPTEMCGTTNYTRSAQRDAPYLENYTNFLVAGMENYIEFHESIAKRCAGFDQMPPFGTCEACRKEFV